MEQRHNNGLKTKMKILLNQWKEMRKSKMNNQKNKQPNNQNSRKNN